MRALAPGETLTLSKDMFADFVPGTGRVGLSVAISASLDIATLLSELDRYPFGCSEQVTSRAVAMLYINELAAQAKLALDGDIDQRIKDAIQRLLARQDSNGSFGLWSVGGNDPWLDAYVTDFLTRARERKFEVPAGAFTLALDRLRNYVASTPDPSKNGGRDLAYALYVLARNGVAPVGDLRYIADTKLNDLATPIAKAQIAAALAMLGDKARADRVYLAALNDIAPQPKLDLGRADYGSALRDSAALVTLASEGRATAKDHRRRGRAHRCRPRAHQPNLDAGRRLAGARRPRARQAAQRHLAFGQRRDPAGHVLSQPARRRTRRAAGGEQPAAPARCRRWCR